MSQHGVQRLRHDVHALPDDNAGGTRTTVPLAIEIEHLDRFLFFAASGTGRPPCESAESATSRRNGWWELVGAL